MAKKKQKAEEKAGNQYEAMFLLGPTATAEPEKALETCRGIIERHAGQVMVIKKWDERKLAYEVGGQKRGTYIISYFSAPGAAVTAIERDVKLSEEILRVLVLKADHLNIDEMKAVEPQPIQVREERPSWDRPPMGMSDDRGPRPSNYERGADRNRPPRRDEAEMGMGKE
ncbi:MAG TPA: 30S ribosomal protein S6 [Tepidisphaeraceae bacterium]|jgi:small subunit ribosomal protein S6|nr:30S ribosomal protein S6 [Tepidisphaeraceae bacterium]